MRSTFKVLFYLKRTLPRRTVPFPWCVVSPLTAPLPSSVANAISILICGTSRAIELREKCRCVGNQPFLDKIRVGINAKYKEIAERDNYVTAEKVKNAFLGLEIRHETLLKVFAQHNEDFFKQVDAGLRCPSTYHKYCTVYKHLEEFIKNRYRVSDIALKELTRLSLPTLTSSCAPKSNAVTTRYGFTWCPCAVWLPLPRITDG